MKIKKSKVTRIITVLLSTVMFFEQFATTDAMFYSHAEDVLSEDYSIEHRITSTWDGGCSAEIILTNLSDKDTKDWTVTFCTTDEITNLWGGTITECREQKTSYGTENKDERVAGLGRDACVTRCRDVGCGGRSGGQALRKAFRQG